MRGPGGCEIAGLRGGQLECGSSRGSRVVPAPGRSRRRTRRRAWCRALGRADRRGRQRPGQRRGEIAGDGAGSPDEHGLVQLAAPLAAKLIGALGLVGQPADHAAGRAALPQRLPHFRDGRAEVLVVGDHHHVDAASRPASPAQRGRQHADPVAQPDHLAQADPGQQDHGRGLGQQVIHRAVHPDPSAVGDHVRLRRGCQDPAYRSPERFQARALLGPADARRGCRGRRAASARAPTPGAAAAHGARPPPG